MNWNKLSVVVIALLALGANQLSARELTEGEWYIRLILKSDTGGLEDSRNQFGQLADAVPGFDSNDMHELGQPFAGTYLSVIFYRPDWETEENPDYEDKETFNTDYHPISSIGPVAGCGLPAETELGDEWTFEVRSDDIYRDLSLSWVGTSTDMKHMVLVDEEEGEIVPAVVDGVTQVYNFTMNGSPVREFTWRLLTTNEYEEFLATGELSPVSAASGEISARSVETDQPAVKRQKSGWLPRGWGQDEGESFRSEPVPDGLPDDPFAD